MSIKRKVSENYLISQAIYGVTQALDPHTSLMPARAFKQLNINTKGSFGGIGIIVDYIQIKLL